MTFSSLSSQAADPQASPACGVRQRLFAGNPGFDALLTCDPQHVAYLSGYSSMSSDMNPHYRIAALVTPDSLRLIVGSADAPAALEMVGDPASIRRYGTFHVIESHSGLKDCRPPLASFNSAVSDAVMEFQPARIALDRTGLGWRELDASLFTADAAPVITRMRLTKTPDEVALLKGAAKLLERGIQAAFAMARPGRSEMEIASAISQEITLGGGVPRSLAVTSGPRAALVDAFPSTRKLQHGDVLRIDLSCTYRGYWADMARTAFIATASDRQIKCFDAISSGLRAEREMIGSGVSAADVFERAVDAVHKNGLPEFRRHHVGHGIGATINEAPLLAPENQQELTPGMVLCIETPYYEEGIGGMMTEDIVLLGEDGVEDLTSLSRELTVLCKD